MKKLPRVSVNKVPPTEGDRAFGAGVAALVTHATGVEVERVVEQSSFSRYYDHVIENGIEVKTDHQETVTKRTLWTKPKDSHPALPPGVTPIYSVKLGPGETKPGPKRVRVRG